MRESQKSCYVTISWILYGFIILLIEKVLNEAVQMNASAIITYHPIIFHGIKKLTPDDRVARIVMG